MKRTTKYRSYKLLTSALILTITACGSSDEPLPVRGNFTVVENMVYAAYGDRELKLDLYLPDQPVSTPVPVVVAIRGGGFRRGDKEAFAPIAGGLADRGIAAVSIEYRTSREAIFPGAIEDTKAAVRWLRSNGPGFGLDPNAIGTIGGSAGGYLAVYLGVTDELTELEGDGGNAGASSRVQAIVAMAPESGPSSLSAWTEFLGETNGRDEEKRTLASSLTHIDNGQEPPLLLIHSVNDSTVPFSESERLLESFTQSNNQAALIRLEGGRHAFWYDAGRFTGVMDSAAEFFSEELVN